MFKTNKLCKYVPNRHTKKAAADALRLEIAYSRHVYSRIVLFRYFVWYMLSFTTKACASDATQANTISPIIIIIFFSFPYINVVFSYLCPSFHLASCLATAYFMKFTLLLTSTASTTAKQQAATTNTIIIIVTLSFFI